MHGKAKMPNYYKLKLTISAFKIKFVVVKLKFNLAHILNCRF